ncbi:MAG: hypothetical protein ACI3ZQ_09875 [Candidatus Cryptobacteroides sp.]
MTAGLSIKCFTKQARLTTWTTPCPCPRIPEDADNLMILAKLKGDGKIINGGEDALLRAAPYPILTINSLLPTSIRTATREKTCTVSQQEQHNSTSSG